MLVALYTAKSVRFAALVLLWLGAYKLATLLDVFRPYSSLWFLPAGVTFSIMLAAPGWLKLSPLVANLLLVSPEFSQFFIESNGGPTTQALHALRHCGVYGLAAYCLIRCTGRSLPISTLRPTLAFVAVVLFAAATAALSGISLHVWAGNMSWETGWSIVVQWTIGDAVAALVLPPILVPVLRRAPILAEPDAPPLPGSSWLLHFIAVSLTLAVGSQAGHLNPGLGSLWYLALIPPIFAGVAGGLSAAAISAFFTCLTTPIAAYLLSYGGEMVALSLLLIIGTIAALLVGAAVSDQRRALADVIGQREKLEEAVVARTSELTDAYDFQRHLVRSIGHDLRQPLQTLAMLVEGMLLRGKFDAQTLEGAKGIAGTMGGFLDGILLQARHDPGVIVPRRTVLSVARLYAKLEAIYGPIAERRQVRLAVQSSNAMVLSDEVLLMQALSNDLDNAIRLSRPGMTVNLRHETRDGADAFIVSDELAANSSIAPGAAGFGQGIVARACIILGAERLEEFGQRGLSFKATGAPSTQNGPTDTPNA